MASSYPSFLDNFSTSHTDNVDEIIHASTINDNADAINKIETELGTLPKGSSADVKTRLSNIQPLSGASAATRYVGGTTSGAPVTGAYLVGDFVVAQNGHIFVCTVAGSPGTWVDAGSAGNQVTSVFSRTGAVVATSGDYTAAQVTNAADLASGSQQAFSAEVKAPDFKAAGLTGATSASRYVGATTTGAPASGTFVIGDYIVTQDGSIYICTTGGSPGTWKSVAGSSGGAGGILAVHQYAPGTLSTYTISATTLTAIDTTNLTVSFTVPASGNVIVRFSGSIEGSGSSTLAFALLNHSGGAQVGNTISNVTNSSSPSYAVLEWYLTGLSAGSLGLDLASAIGAGGGSGKVWAQGFTGSSSLNGSLGPAILTVIEA